MSNYNWGVDGYGRAHICNSDNVIIFIMIDGGGQMGIWILEAQDIDEAFERGDYYY